MSALDDPRIEFLYGAARAVVQQVESNRSLGETWKSVFIVLADKSSGSVYRGVLSQGGERLPGAGPCPNGVAWMVSDRKRLPKGTKPDGRYAMLCAGNMNVLVELDQEFLLNAAQALILMYRTELDQLEPAARVRHQRWRAHVDRLLAAEAARATPRDVGALLYDLYGERVEALIRKTGDGSFIDEILAEFDVDDADVEERGAELIHGSVLERLGNIAFETMMRVEPDTSCWATKALLVAHHSSAKNFKTVSAMKSAAVNRVDGFTYAVAVGDLAQLRRSTPKFPAVKPGRWYAMLFAGRETRVATINPGGCS